MSEPWPSQAFADARAVPIWTRPVPKRFAAAPGGLPGRFSPWAAEPEAPAPAEPERDIAAEIDAVRADAFAQGFDAGARTERDLVQHERAALTRLANAIESFRPEPAADLARLLAESVSRLVRQVCGEVEPDPALLAERTMAVAALIQDETGPARLRLHPADVARLEGAAIALPLVADPALAEGTILAETATGWIEDGPAVRLERLRAMLEAMGCGR